MSFTYSILHNINYDTFCIIGLAQRLKQ